MPSPEEHPESVEGRLRRVREAMIRRKLDALDPEVRDHIQEEQKRRRIHAVLGGELPEPETQGEFPVTYLCPGAVTATVNAWNPNFERLQQVLSECGAVPVVEKVASPVWTPAPSGENLPWKEVARRLNLPRYSPDRVRPLMAFCRRQAVGSPLHALLKDRSPAAVEKARQALKVIVD